MTQDDAPEVIGSAEAAQILGLSRRQLHRITQRGDLDAIVKLAGKTGAYMYGRATVVEFKRSRTRRRPTAASDETRAAS